MSASSALSVVSADPPNTPPTVSADVTDDLEHAGFYVERVSGNDQYRTGVAAAQRLGGAGDLARFGPTAIIASGEVFADALVAGPLAARNRIPLLLTPKAGLHPDVAEYLTDAQVKRVVLMGGTAALSAEVQTGIEALGITVDHIAGVTRFETATMFADYAAQHGGECWAEDQVGLARAFLPFDSFSAAPLLAQLCAPAVLTDPAEIPDTTLEFLNEARRGQDRITLRVFGGNAAVSQDSIDTYLNVIEPTSDGNYKNRSENSVLPATDRYFIDHDEVSSLFPDCPTSPPTNQNTLRFRRGLQERYAGFGHRDHHGAVRQHDHRLHHRLVDRRRSPVRLRPHLSRNRRHMGETEHHDVAMEPNRLRMASAICAHPRTEARLCRWLPRRL